jgi:multimeric flavodoxin WrbA
MQVLVLVGSYRKAGNTARIARMVEARMQDRAARDNAALDFETVFLGDLDVRPCRGCRACFDRGEDACPLKDDVALIRARIEAADALVLAGPVYVDDVSGLMKNLMDRLAYLCHRPALGGKYALALATVGGGGAGHALRTMYVALLTWGCHMVGRTGFKTGALASEDELRRFRPGADAAADRLFDAIVRKRNDNPSFVSLMAFRIQQLSWRRTLTDSYDGVYWRTRGWLESGSTYYRAHRASPVKVALARLAGAVLYPFVA